MHIDVINNYSNFEKLRTNWDALYQIDPEAQFFLSWDWLSQLFTRRREYWFYILAAKPNRSENNYVAFFPLRLSLRTSKNDLGFHNEITMAGNYWADYNGFICDPDYEQQAIPALAMQLKRMYWARLNLDYILISDRRLALFIDQFPDNSFDITHGNRLSEEDNIDNLVAPYINLPDDFDAYLATHMSAKTRQKLRRYTRKVTNSPELQITHTNTKTCERDLAALGDFWTTKWSQRKTENVTRLATTYKQILRQALQANMLYMPVLWRANQPLGVLGSLVDWQKKTLLFFVAGRNESCHDLPIGLLLHGHSIRWAIEHELTTYDFLAGNEPYKYSYGVQEQQLQCITLSTKSKTNLNDMLDPRCIEAALKKATRSHREGMLTQAESGYRQVLRIRPDDLEAQGSYARLLTETGDHARALTIHQRVTGKHPDNVAAWICIGESYFAMGAFQDACSALERAVGLSSNKSIKALYYLGRAQLGLDRKAAATTTFHTILKLAPTSRRDEKRQLKVRQYIQNT